MVSIVVFAKGAYNMLRVQDCATPMSGYLGKNSLSKGPSSKIFLKHGWVWVKFTKKWLRMVNNHKSGCESKFQ